MAIMTERTCGTGHVYVTKQHRQRRVTIAASVALVLTALPAYPVSGEDAAASAPVLEPEVMEIVGRMADFLSSRPAFEVQNDVTYDVRQASGEMLQFGRRQHLRVRRPNQLQAIVERDDGVRREVWYDGETLTQWYAEDNAYGRVEAPGTIDSLLDLIEEEYKIPLPMANLLRADIGGELLPKFTSGSVVGEHWVGDVLCDHVAVGNDRVDAQLWIAKGDAPLLQKVVISYKTYPGTPQFAAVVHGWNVQPDFEAGTFQFTPPEDAHEITVLRLPADVWPGTLNEEAS